MSFPRYPEYKDSGVEWLGQVPGHWDVTLSKRFLTVQSGDMINSSEEMEVGYPLIGGNGIRAYTNKWNSSGDTLVIGRVGAKCGCVHHIKEDFWASEHAFRVIEKQPLSRRFFFHLLSAIELNKFAIKTAQPLLNTEIVETQWISVPPLPEQTEIAAFLDRETAKIDSLVTEQRRLMALLKEKRQAVISHAVTRGLNPDAPMKPSGIEWLGDVPAHWDVGQSRRLFALRNERASEADKQLTASQEHGVIYQEDFIRLEGRRVVQVIKGADILKHVEPNDFVISMRSFQGGIEWCQVRGCISSAYVMLVPCERIHGQFFQYLFKSQSYIQALQTTSNLVRDGQALRYDNFTQVDLPLVPLIEQAQIADFLDSETVKFDTLTAEAQRAIDLLQERRTALVSAAVTGQIDVRGALQTEVEKAVA